MPSPSATRTPEKGAGVAGKVGVGAKGGSVKEVVGQADVIILAVKYENTPAALAAAGDLTNKIVIDITSPITADYKALTIGHSTSAAEEIQKLVPSAKVVKAFNTIFAELLPIESRVGRKVDETAKAKVSDIIMAVEFEPVDCGPLYNSRFLEPMGEMNIWLGFF